MIKYPSIEQFRNIVRAVRTNHDYKGKDETGAAIYRHDSPYPTIEFTGTVKLHGTNAAIVKYKDRIEFQSRERVLSLIQDNAGFMLTMMNQNLDPLFEGIDFNDHIAIFGEWCGQGIQKGVGISELPKRFVIFGCEVDGEWRQYHRVVAIPPNVYNIISYQTWGIEIDFNNPELAQNELVRITEEVEKECPVAKSFGVSGIGEGVVWKSKNQEYIFKVKGEKHSVSKVKTLASVDVEMVNGINEFVEKVVTENRLEQGFGVLCNRDNIIPDQTNTGEFLKWMVTDVLKEEQDTIVQNQLEVKKVGAAVSKKAREWYFKKLDELNLAMV